MEKGSMRTGIEVIDNVQSAVESLQSEIDKNTADILSNEKSITDLASACQQTFQSTNRFVNIEARKLFFRTWIFSIICLIQGLCLTYLLVF
jgi:hypothetical protein